MPDRLSQVLSFAGVAAGGQATLPYELGVGGVSVLPDFIFVNAAGFEVILPVGLGTITVQNNNLVPASVDLWLLRQHTIDRVYGSQATLNLSPQPFIVYSSDPAGGGGSSNAQVFRYIATGAEGTDFNITLPAARASDLYNVFCGLGSVVANVPVSFPDTLAGDRTATQFRCITTAALQANDQLDLLVIDRT
jgi:hypothetical protein